MNTKNETIRKMYESKLEKLGNEKSLLEERVEIPVDMEIISRTAMEKMMETIKSPYVIWTNCDARQKRDFYKYIFIEDFTIARDRPSRTPALSQIYEYLQGDSRNDDTQSRANSIGWTLTDSNR